MYLDRQNKMLFGVCAGIADKTGVDPLVVRVLTVISFVVSGTITFWGYLILGAMLPDKA